MSDETREPRPVILGTGFAAMAISRALSEAGLEHDLVGPAPSFDAPRIGESLDLVASADILYLFPELEGYTLQKSYLWAIGRQCSLQVDFDAIGDAASSRVFMRSLGLTLPVHRALHLDRNGFDREVWERVSAQEAMTHHDALVSDLSYDADSDRVTRVELADGTVLEPSHVFDATNHARVVARAIGLPCEFISEERWLVYGHQHGDVRCDETAPWTRASSLLPLVEEDDGITGLAWAIPLGDHISLGMSLERNCAAMPKEEAMQRLVACCERYGIPVGRHFPRAGTPVAHPHRYYTHERAYGANWFLAAGAYGQAHFVSSSGFTTSLAAAHAAVRFVRGDTRGAQRCQELSDRLTGFQPVFEELSRLARDGSVPEVLPVAREWIVANFVRMSSYGAVRPTGIAPACSGVLSSLFRSRILRPEFIGFDRFWKVEEHPRAEGLTAAAS